MSSEHPESQGSLAFEDYQAAMELDAEAKEEAEAKEKDLEEAEENDAQEEPDEEELALKRADDDEVILGTQNDVAEFYSHAQGLAEDCVEDYDKLVAEVLGKKDPCEGAKDRLRALARLIWLRISGADLKDASELSRQLRAAPADRLDAFFEQWSALLFDVKAVYKATELHQKPKSMKLRAFIAQSVRTFYDKLLSGKESRSAKQIQEDSSLKSMAPLEIALACQRIAVGYGLPPDGIFVRQLHQGQVAYYWHGADGSLLIPALAAGESEWDVGNTRLPLIGCGPVSCGKDNGMAVYMTWIKSLQIEGLQATTVMRSGNITTTGILKALKQHQNQLQIANGELEKVMPDLS